MRPTPSTTGRRDHAGGETAAGRIPCASSQTLDVIIREAESMPSFAPVVRYKTCTRLLGAWPCAICEAAVTLADRGDAAAIVAVTRGGKTARVLSALRPPRADLCRDRSPDRLATG